MSIFLFESQRLRCRRWTPEDLDVLFAIYSDPQAMRWVGDGQPITREECKGWLRVTAANYEMRGYGMFAFYGMFALKEKSSGHVVGCCGLVHPGGQPQVEVKYAFLRSHWGLGLASEAVPALLAYGCANYGLARVIATVAPMNFPSQRVLIKAGMTALHVRRNEDGSHTQVFEWLAKNAD